MKDEVNKEKKEAAMKKAALAKFSKEFGAEELGQGHHLGGAKKNLGSRIAMLDRLKLRAPDLPPDMEAEWKYFAKVYASWIAASWKAAVGWGMIEEVKKVMESLGQFCRSATGESQVGLIKGGWDRTFEDWIVRNQSKLKKSGTKLVV